MRSFVLAAGFGALIPLLLPPAASAQIPSFRGRYQNLPCLAPFLRQMDPVAPRNIEEALLLPPHQSPKLRDGLGRVSFPITTTRPDLQPCFNQGVALLHLLWTTEAERCFRKVAAGDPYCSMAYWGMALANARHPGRAAVYLRRAMACLSRQPGITPRERAWLEVYHAYWNPDPAQAPSSDTHRRLERIRALERIALSHPEDVEAQAFLLRHLVLDEFRAGIPIERRYLVDLLAEKIAAAAPAHPSRHYRVFLWLETDPARARDLVPAITQLSPGVPDTWRYAAQVHAASGHPEPALACLETTLRASHRHVATHFLMPDELENFAANSEAYIDALCSAGRLREAVAAAGHLLSLPRRPRSEREGTLGDEPGSCLEAGRRSLFQSYVRHERWRQILDAVENGPLQANATWEGRAHAIYWRAIALENLGRTAEAEAAAEALETISREAETAAVSLGVRAPIERCRESLETYRRLRREGADLSLPGKGLLHLPDDHLARAAFKAGRRELALELAARDLERRPRQLLATATFCDLARRSGQTGAARLHFTPSFRRAAGAADRDLPFHRWMKPLAKTLRLHGNWTLPPEASAPVPGLSDPAQIGPIRWSPPQAPAWSLPDSDGSLVSLESHRGKPLLLLFILGLDCPYCTEQLEVFRPLLPAFEEAGISTIAITSDTRENLARFQEERDAHAADGSLLLLADPSLETFRAYRAYSDFEACGLHGTFLISPSGDLLWQDISHDPFGDPAFLLGEARRLLTAHAD